MTKYQPYGIYEKYIKRLLDILCGLAAVTVFSWLYLILIILGAICMRGNPFFVQERVGKDEKIFKLIKFRTMDNRKDGEGNLLPDEIRLNKYGRFLRKTSLDEIAEAFNIIKGDMSVIGPRPLLSKDVAYMNALQCRRHEVRPGLTGLAQCRGRNSLNWDIKLANDVEYVNNLSFSMDIRILFKTIWIVIKQENVEYDEKADLDLKDWIAYKQCVGEDNVSEGLYDSTV